MLGSEAHPLPFQEKVLFTAPVQLPFVDPPPANPYVEGLPGREPPSVLAEIMFEADVHDAKATTDFNVPVVLSYQTCPS
jgi:hypothetical protein